MISLIKIVALFILNKILHETIGTWLENKIKTWRKTVESVI